MIAKRVSRAAPFLVMDIYARATALQKEGRDIIHMEVGEPDFDTPACVIDAAKEALDQGQTHYTTSLGDLELREAISGWYARHYGVAVDPRRVVVCPGTSPGMAMLFAALAERGDEVVLSNPGYPCYKTFTAFSGATPVLVETAEEDGFRFEPSDVARKITPQTKAMIINSPCNPTGILLEPERMKALAELGPLVISDEIYHGLNYSGQKDHTILEYTDNAVVVGGFSKAFAMTGWRLGYLIIPEQLIRPMEILMQNFFISTSAMVQKAGIAALAHAEKDVLRMRELYDERRKVLVAGLKDLGFQIPVEPLGAFYVLVNARHLGQDSLALANDILEKVGVGAAPGIDFGSRSEGFLRFSYADSVEHLQEALRRLKTYVEARG